MTNPIGTVAPTGAARARRFGLSDAMILIAAVAVGLALARGPAANFVSEPPWDEPGTPLRRALVTVIHGMRLGYPMLAALTPAAVIVRLRCPRPPLRRLFRQPGVVACAAGAVALATALLEVIPLMYPFYKYISFNDFMLNVWLFAAERCGYAVAGAWLALALGGRWRLERSRSDRLCLMIGASWMGIVALEFAESYLDLVKR